MTRALALRSPLIARLAWLAFLVVAPATPAMAARSGSPLIEPYVIWTPAAPGSREPRLAVSPDGTVFMSWFERRDSTHHALRLARFVRGSWSEPVTVAEGDSFFVNWADFPQLLALDGRKLVMAWPWKSGGEPYAYDVRIAGSTDGGRRWTPPIVPHRDGTPTEHGFVSLVPAQAGGVRAFWLDGRKFAERKPAASDSSGHDEHDGGETTLRTAWIGLDGALMDEVEVDDRVCDCCQTGAVGRSGRALVAYRDRSSDEVRDISVAWLEGGRWSEPAPVHPDGWRIPGCPVNGPALDMAGDRVVVAWFTMKGDSARVLAAISNDRGRRFGAPIRLDQGNPLGRTDVEMLDDGSALVSWLEVTGQEALIQVRRLGSRGEVSEPVTVARTSTGRASGFPRMVRSRGLLLFAWTETGETPQVKVATARLP
jgi:hypothetical protein